MAENIGGADLFGSGGHVWVWNPVAANRKVLQTVGTYGAGSLIVNVGPRTGVIQGRLDGPAVLQATGATRAIADAAMTALEDAIEDTVCTNAAYDWEDDHGHTGTESLEVVDYIRVGPRKYGRSGADWAVWQHYRCTVRDLAGGRG